MAASPQLLAPYISRDEYACPCCGQLPFDFDPDHPSEPFVELFAAFSAIRTAWGSPLPINSGYRCEKHNAEIKGEPLSAHLFGLALDLSVPSTSAIISIRQISETVWPKLRIGWRRYLNSGTLCVHIDTAYMIRPRPTAKFIEGARW